MGAVLGTAPPESRVEPRARPGVFNVAEVLAHLIDEEDTDHDKKITVADPLLGGRGRGDRRFLLKDGTGAEFEIVGTYPLSNLLQELTLARELTITHNYSRSLLPARKPAASKVRS